MSVREIKSLFVAAAPASPVIVLFPYHADPPKVEPALLADNPPPNVNPPTEMFDAVVVADSGLLAIEFLPLKSQPAKVT